MKTKTLLVFLFFTSIVYSQNSSQILDGSKPFILNFTTMEFRDKGTDRININKASAKVVYHPHSSIKEKGSISIYSNNYNTQTYDVIRSGRQLLNEKWYYMANIIGFDKNYFLWTKDDFIFLEGDSYLRLANVNMDDVEKLFYDKTK